LAERVSASHLKNPLSFSTYVFQAGKTHTRTHTKIADLGGQLQTVENECGAESSVHRS